MARIIAGQVGEWPFDVMKQHEAEEGAWVEMSEEHWWYSLEVLPPIYFAGGFAVSEPWKEDEQGRPMYAACVQVGRRYFVRHLAVADMAREAAALRQAVGA